MNKIKAERSKCAIALTLDIVGDKWSLLVVRDLFFGKKRYNEFLTSPEKIPTNILAERLRRLEYHGIISKDMYQQTPARYNYNLTQKGEDMLVVLQSMCRWAGKYMQDIFVPPEELMNRAVDI